MTAHAPTLSVQKRDGRLEPYQDEKLARVLKAAWCTPEQIGTIVPAVTDRVHAAGKNPIPSSDIREIVEEEIKAVNEEAYDFFHWYQADRRAR